MSFSSNINESNRIEAIALSNEEIKRYSRHLVMPEVTMEGQKKLKAGRVLCVGAGGLGSPLLAYLAAAGIGRLGIVDFDRVDVSNLQRQVIHSTRDVGKLKTESAVEAIRAINPHVEAVAHTIALKSSNAMEILRDYDVIADGSDNFATRYLINDACVLLGKAHVYGAVFRFEGQASVFWARQGPCYRCLHPEPPPSEAIPSCAEGGVLGATPGIIGTIQAIEAIKLLMDLGDSLVGRLLLFDALKMKFRELKIRKDAACPICGSSATIRSLEDYDFFCGSEPADGPRRRQLATPRLTPRELKTRMDRGELVVLLDVREPHEQSICALPGAWPMPLGDLSKRMHELDSAREIVIYCKGETRSLQAARQLQQGGFRKLHILAGGIEGWWEEIDPAMPSY